MSGEFDLIRRYFLPLASAPGALGLSDDAALLGLDPGQELVITTDTIIESVHYLADDPPDSVGGKLLGVNLSDLAAMGAAPLGYVLAVALPTLWGAAQREGWLADFARGLASMQTMFRIGMLGGDTVATPGPPCLTVTAFGEVPQGAALRRSGARPGDLVFVSGTLGDAALGLHLQTAGFGREESFAGAAALIERYRWPRPRVDLGVRLRGLVHGAADVSDGLVADLAHICRASGVAAEIDAARIPLSSPAAALLAVDPGLLPLVLGGGDDYELVFTAPPVNRDAIAAAAAAAAVTVSCIGTILQSATEAAILPVRVVAADGDLLPGFGGYEHFSHVRND